MARTSGQASVWSSVILIVLWLTTMGGTGCSRRPAFDSVEWTGTDPQVALRLENRLPFLPVTVGQHGFELLLDLGGAHAVTLTPGQLSQAKGVRFTGKTRRWTNVKGHVMKSRIFVLPEMQIGPLRFLEVRGVEAVQDPAYPTPHHTGTIGRGILDAVPVLIDFSRASISFLTRDTPRPVDLDVEDWSGLPGPWVEVELSSSSYGNVVSVDVGGRRLDLLLDTGATHSFLQPRLLSGGEMSTVEVATVSGSLGFIHFESFAFDMPPVDGFLGFDFFLDHPVVVDKPAGYIYVAVGDSVPPTFPR